MESLKEALSLFVTGITKSVGIYTTVFGIFFYHVVLDKDLQCTCEDQTHVCRCYMAIPVFIILVMLLWLDGSFQVLLKSCLKNTKRFCCFWCLYIFRAVFISLLWPISVMIDGDWFICCEHKEKLYCKELTFEDQNIIKELKNKSRIGGFCVLLGLIFVAVILRFPWMECCPCLKACCTELNESSPCLSKCCTCESECLRKDAVFKKIVLEEGENLVTNKLIEVAKGKIDEKIDKYVVDREWWKCYGVVEEIFEEPPPDKSSSEDKETEQSEKSSGLVIKSPPQHPNNTNPLPDGSPPSKGRGNGSVGETDPLLSNPSQGSSSAEDRGNGSGNQMQRIYHSYDSMAASSSNKAPA